MFIVSICLFRSKSYTYAKFFPIFVLLFALIFFLYSKKYSNFYNGEWFVNPEQPSESWLNILYSNILYRTKNYSWLLEWIDENNSDVLLMVEFTEDFDLAMRSVLLEKYPYTARMSFADKYYWNVIFSKYPVENLSNQIDWWTWRYSHFLIKYDDINYYVYLVHTASPISNYYFKMRNSQLSELVEDFSQNKYSENDRVLIIWDFNTSPWSYYYWILDWWFSWMTNLTKNFTHLFTRKLKFLPFIASHIDHIFVDKNAKIDNIMQVDTPLSDHKWFYIYNFR